MPSSQTKPDNNFESIVDAHDVEFCYETIQPEHPEQYDDILKLSRTKDCRFIEYTICGGGCRENALDLNNGSTGNFFRLLETHGGRQCAIVVKGGSSAEFDSLMVTPHPEAKYDLELGGWSDQSMRRSSVLLSGLSARYGHPEFLPLRVVCGWWSLPKVEGKAKVQILWGRSIAYHLYNLAKFLWTRGQSLYSRAVATLIPSRTTEPNAQLR